MRTKYETGEYVWVPAAKIGGDQPFALMRRRVEGQVGRSVMVDGAGGATIKISSRLVHKETLGFLVLKVGDLVTESTLLDPLAKSALQYLRLLVPDEIIHSLSIRTEAELTAYMSRSGSAITHVVVVGHGTADSLVMLPGSYLTADDFVTAMGVGDVDRCLISAACKSGRKSFAGAVSAADGWRDVVAPHAAVHGAGASLFLQFLLHAHLLHGHEFRTSARLADAATEGIRFRHWRNGRLVSSNARTTLIAQEQSTAE